MTADPRERADLAELFTELGPAAPTILPGWDAAALLEHLLVRERYGHRQLAARLPGPLGRGSRSFLEELRERPWDELVAMLRDGPGRSPVGMVDALTGGAEILIHHEDLRRAQPGWERRDLPPQVQAQAWHAVGLFSRVTLRVDADITLVSPLGGRRRAARRADGSLRVHGEPLELLLWVTGRDDVAQVRVHGDEGGLAALQRGRRAV